MLNKVNLPKQIIPKIEEFATMHNLLPCVVIIHDLRDWLVLYMSKRGLDGLQTSIEDIISITAQEYYKRYFNADDAQDYVPKILTLISINTAETHRKNIKKKLNAGTYELMQYARAFDLI
ncbi:MULTISPECIES: hypothetical protein [unclassified Mucilaginibacter]|nr:MULTISPECIES: hypothetical protein [unclassified Mucilaginibacter]MEB0278317.1 hypothetical protein [Mucilaginibacter sp. 10B2]MEB0301184.1 hypothetical protein [Mucilaginibacter sp. 5C4]WPX23963.1 hypothetical protein RHM67_01555 [Mucilaginibacter sp. 5C4]